MKPRHIPTNGAAIRAIRIAYGVKLYQLAADVGVSDGTLGKIETGRMNAQMPLLRRIAARLNVPLQAVMLIRVEDVDGQQRTDGNPQRQHRRRSTAADLIH